MIYDLAIEGADAGVFSDSILSNVGQVKLLLSLLAIILRAKIPLWHWKNPPTSLEIFYADSNVIGFAHLLTQTNNAFLEQEIVLCAIVPEFRGQGHGKVMIRMLIERLPVGTKITVKCSKYAKRMRALLQHLHFQRDKQQYVSEIGNLQVFRYVRVENAACLSKINSTEWKTDRRRGSTKKVKSSSKAKARTVQI